MGLWIQNFKQALRGLRHQGWQAMVSVSGLAVSIVGIRICMYWNGEIPYGVPLTFGTV